MKGLRRHMNLSGRGIQVKFYGWSWGKVYYYVSIRLIVGRNRRRDRIEGHLRGGVQI